ncbi:MAG: M23 family metallopeptidase [Spirochaetes bacterium]|nr:M23 family metallopeptidase [Spirochaetota bacterium]
MMKIQSIFKYIFVLVYIFFLYFSAKPASSETTRTDSIIKLESLNPKNEIIKEIRNDIRKSISIIKRNNDPENLPELRFFTYKVRKNENFWNIMAKSSLNMDTLSSINSLVSVKDISQGEIIHLSNMRGILYKTETKDTLDTISRKTGVHKKYIQRVNKLTDNGKIDKEYIFIPSAKMSQIERSLLLGVGFANPLKTARKTSAFGRRIDPFDKKFAFHTGIDLACPIGSKIYASRSGKVIFTGNDGGYGLLVKIKHENCYSTYYGHLKKVLVKKGEDVKRGQVIALSGNSGRSTGPHLHFEVRKENRPINPVILLNR